MSSFLICCTPAVGHVVPLLAVARHLVEAGHDVRFLSGRPHEAAIRATGAEFLALPRDADVNLDNPNVDFPERSTLSGIEGIRFDIQNLFLRPAPLQLEAVDAAIADRPVDAILAEPLFAAAPLILARPVDQRPAVVNLGIVALGLPGPGIAPTGFGVPPLGGPIGAVRNAVLRAAAARLFAPIRTEVARMTRELIGVEPDDTDLFAWPGHADAIVQFTVPGFEYPRPDLPTAVTFVGPVSRTQPSTEPLPEWWGDLDGSRPVIHVTQGTVANKDFDQLVKPTVAALADRDVLVVVSTGKRPVDELGPLPTNARAGSYLPYDKLLPLTSVLITNGGYGGVHYALEHGVPLVVAGKTEDKVEVSARVAWSGAGIDLRTNTPTSARIRAAVEKVLGDPRYAAASRRLADEIAASPGLAGLDAAIEKVLAKRAKLRD